MVVSGYQVPDPSITAVKVLLPPKPLLLLPQLLLCMLRSECNPHSEGLRVELMESELI